MNDPLPVDPLFHFMVVNTEDEGRIEFSPDGAEGVAFWIHGLDMEDEPHFSFTYPEAEQIHHWLTTYVLNPYRAETR